MTRERWMAGALWLGLTAVGEALIWNANIFPGGFAEEADVSSPTTPSACSCAWRSPCSPSSSPSSL